MTPTPPIPNSYWARPGQLLAGEYPSDWSEETSRKRLRRLLEAGVTFFLDLTEAGEYGLRSYAPLLDQGAVALGREVEHRRMAQVYNRCLQAGVGKLGVCVRPVDPMR